MCFSEYIGYGCGHTTVAVLRPCPLTTHLHTNPVCPSPAQRPTQVHTMCPSCARILHTRWVEIVTLEHQWMHERGVCGCPVVFPALQEPRIVGGERHEAGYSSDGGEDQQVQASNAQTVHIPSGTGPVMLDPESYSRAMPGKEHAVVLAPKAVNSSSDTPAHPKPKNKGKGKTRSKHSGQNTKAKANQNQKPHAMAWNRNISPIVDITQDYGTGNKIAVRLSSQYGAEWIPDHAQLHAAGKCECAVAFETYKPHSITAVDLAAAPEWDMQKPIKALHTPTFRRNDLLIWKINEANPGMPQIPWPIQMEEFGFTCCAEAEACLEEQERAAAGQASKEDELLLSQIPQFGQRGPFPYPAAAYGIEGAAHGGNGTSAQRSAAVGREQQPAHDSFIAIPNEPIFCPQGIPLVGWPLGAGPEGGRENSHSPAWNMCSLSRPRIKRSCSLTF
ncbi:uncharacterized protein JN550_003370 [Neoarthrinium moseri]|uniref:uncharacterized protein n=1 Tax=Neoarthrinium moseri TaxID=1658444 RepID=UPI001FDD83F7|nr:uncharacterized protein JN550_003370 [Neoarthrinium moseri]KAI1873117.1 hypothetical protein JN550_003370 [Neoarthrinium moseri]